MLPRPGPKTILIALAALAVPASCTQILGIDGDYTLGDGPTGGNPGGGSSIDTGGSGGGVPEICTDDTQNGDETDIDCGGTLCPRCPIEKACEAGSDCQSGLCTDLQCACPDGAVPDASGACTCAAVALLCADGCQPFDTYQLDETGIDQVIAPKIAVLANGTFGVSWVRKAAEDVAFASVTADEQLFMATSNGSVKHGSSSLTPGLSPTDFVLSTVHYANTPGTLRSYTATGGKISDGYTVRPLFDSDRIDCARVAADVRCMFYHVQPVVGPTVQSARFHPAVGGPEPPVDLNDAGMLNASQLAFPAIASDDDIAFMVWTGENDTVIRYAIDDSGTPNPALVPLEVASVGEIRSVDVARSNGFWVVAWAESEDQRGPFRIGLATFDDSGQPYSETKIALADAERMITGPLSLAIGETGRGTPTIAIAYPTLLPTTELHELQLLYVDHAGGQILADSPAHGFATLAAEDGGGELDAPELAFHSERGLGMSSVHRAASTDETPELRRLPVCELFAPE